jgi:hypothetical protein
MPLIVKDRVQETSSTAGTGTLTLSGAVSSFSTFSSAIGNGNTTYYSIVGGTEWEVGIGTVAAGTLSRDTVLSNSLGTTALVNFAAGVKNVFVTYPADKAVTIDGVQTLTNKTLTSPTLTTPALPNAGLVNSSITINGSSVSLGGTASVGTVTSVTGTAPVVSSGGATPAISMAAATTSVNGYLTSTDWNTFNGKQDALTSGTNIKTVNSTSLLGSGNISVGTVTSVTGTAPVVSSGGATPAISMAAASSGVNGYMTGTYATKLDGIAAGATNVTNTNQLTNGAGFITGSGNAATATYATTAGRAYPYRVGGVDLNFNWSGQSGQPPWLWGGSDGSNMYVYNPSNFSVNYANTAGSAPANGGTSAACSGNAATATQLSTATGSAPSYSARAWVNFNGTGTVAIRASGNVSSITDNGTGNYTVNFSTAMPNADYAIQGAIFQTGNTSIQGITGGTGYAFAAGSCTLFARTTSGATDATVICISVFR